MSSAPNGIDYGREENAKTVEHGVYTKLGKGTAGRGLLISEEGASEREYLRHTTPKLASLESTFSHLSLDTRSVMGPLCKFFYTLY